MTDKEHLTTQFFTRLGQLGRLDPKASDTLQKQTAGVMELYKIIDLIWEDGKQNGIEIQKSIQNAKR